MKILEAGTFNKAQPCSMNRQPPVCWWHTDLANGFDFRGSLPLASTLPPGMSVNCPRCLLPEVRPVLALSLVSTQLSQRMAETRSKKLASRANRSTPGCVPGYRLLLTTVLKLVTYIHPPNLHTDDSLCMNDINLYRETGILTGKQTSCTRTIGKDESLRFWIKKRFVKRLPER